MMNLKVVVRRGEFPESVHRVSAAVVDGGDRLIDHAGDPQGPVFWRSAAKYFQALAIVESGAVERFGLTEEELAVACGSHNGEDFHLEAVRSLLHKIDAREEDLHCGPHPPMGREASRALRARGEVPTRLHNNCSGKHAGMLAVCRQRGWPLKDYNRIRHPLQQEILGIMSQATGVPRDQIHTAVDGCGAVVFRTPLLGLARAFRRLAQGALPEPHQAAGLRVRDAALRHPDMVAGAARLCTALIHVSGGRLIGKVGAEGVYGLAVTQPRGEAAHGLAVKVEDGGDRALAPVVCHLARHLGWLNAAEMEALKPHWTVVLTNHQQERVGDVQVRIEPLGA